VSFFDVSTPVPLPSHPNVSRRCFFPAVSMFLPPLPPPSCSNASWRWFCSMFQRRCYHFRLPRVQTRVRGGFFFGVLAPLMPVVSFPWHQGRWGGVWVYTALFECFPCPSGLLGRRVISPPSLPPSNNNEGGLLVAALTTGQRVSNILPCSFSGALSYRKII